MTDERETISEDAPLFQPIVFTGRNFYITVGILGLGMLWGAISYYLQNTYGLGVTGLNQPVSWGFYITNFVFFIGISHAGTLISAILRIAKAEWRRPITRMAEVITVMVLFLGAANIIIDLGRPDRALFVLQYGRYQSPLLWDVTSITTYLTASSIYLYLPLIPDIAILRDSTNKWRWLYNVLSLGWSGTLKQQKVLNKAISIMAIMVIPIAVSVHSVVSFVFSMTLQPMWHSTIFGPYFVAGAIFSGIAALIITMIIIRKVFGLEGYLKPIHFNHLGVLLLIMSLLWFYFTFAEYLTGYYGNEPEEMKVFWTKFSGSYWPYFWAMVLLNFVIPVLILSFKQTRTIPGTLVASISIVIGMWLERFIIIVPTLANPRLSYPAQIYLPSIIELGITVGSFATFIFLYVVFTKFFPIISIWEIREGREVGLKEVEERVRAYMPSPETGKIG